MGKKSKKNKIIQNSENQNKEQKQNKEKDPKTTARTPPKRKSNDLYKLYEKEILNQEQYASGERLLLDYESSFKNKCTMAAMDDARVQKSNKINNEFHIIQNLNAWDRYSKAISSIEDLKTREVVREFCIEGKGLTEIDNRMGKRGVAEVRLGYGLSEVARFYTGKKKNNINK